MEILGFAVVILLGSIIGSGLALWRKVRAKPRAETDPFIEVRYGRMASEFGLGGVEAV